LEGFSLGAVVVRHSVACWFVFGWFFLGRLGAGETHCGLMVFAFFGWLFLGRLCSVSSLSYRWCRDDMYTLFYRFMRVYLCKNIEKGISQARRE
jgi:hypothetical protein